MAPKGRKPESSIHFQDQSQRESSALDDAKKLSKVNILTNF
jgi:hypothetical protein